MAIRAYFFVASSEILSGTNGTVSQSLVIGDRYVAFFDLSDDRLLFTREFKYHGSGEAYQDNFSINGLYQIELSIFDDLAFYIREASGQFLSFDMSSDFFGVVNNGGGSTNTGGFSVPDLDGNFGAYSNGLTVTVLGRKGDYTIEASQQLWSFPADSFQGSCVIYKLSQNGKILLAPHFLVTLKAS